MSSDVTSCSLGDIASSRMGTTGREQNSPGKHSVIIARAVGNWWQTSGSAVAASLDLPFNPAFADSTRVVG